MDRRHPGQVIQHFLNLFDDFLENKETHQAVLLMHYDHMRGEQYKQYTV